MKAAVNERYGPPDVVSVRDLPKPVAEDREILVRVHASTVSRSDCGMRQGHPFFIRAVTGLLRPKITVLGLDFAGEVDTVGAGVSKFKPGDRVFGVSPSTYGAHAEYLRIAEDGPVAMMPAGLDFGEAVVCEGAWYANTNLEHFGLGEGHSILIYGASGAIGTAAVQLAKARSAEVTAVVATKHMDLVRSLGADHVIDYTAEDFTAIGRKFDFVFDAVGKTSYFECRPLLKSEGRFAATDLGPWWQNIWLPVFLRGRVSIPMPECSQALIEFLKARIEAGELRAVIDRSYRLDDIVGAYRYVETATKTGIVVLDIDAGSGG